MADYTLVKETNPILITPADPWDWTHDGDVTNIARDMLKIMFENYGIGLAATQLGINKRIFVMGNPQLSYICVNPEIIEGQGRIKDEEGCLSFPGLYLHVNRYESVKVKYYDMLGREHINEFKDIQSRVFQHEFDHLNGVCFVNKVSKLSLELATKRRKKNIKRK